MMVRRMWASTLLFLVILVPFRAVSQADSAIAASALAHRVLGAKADAFRFESCPAEDGFDVFEIAALDGVATIRGSGAVAMASGLNWYLKYACHASISWAGDQLELPDPLPDAEPVRRVTPHRYRYYFNYCTFSYTMAWWDWSRWEREIDWMALNGINMPLSVTGQEAVWRELCGELGLTKEETAAFLVGPAYLPFGWMGCIDGWGGPLPDSWIDAHRELELRILARERELGMTPVLQGFTGHVPEALERVFPNAKFQQLPSWCGFPGTHFVDPADPLFVEIGQRFLRAQTQLFGTNHLYASDTFIEMSPPSDDPAFLEAMGKAVYEAMAGADPEAVWVMQGWIFVNNPNFWKPPQAKALFNAVPGDRLLLLDLYCETRPAWSLTEAFYGRPWVWCVIHNFGGNTNLFGRLAAIAEGPPAALKDPGRGRLSGIGMMMEGIEQNPIVYDLMMEMTWRTEPPDLEAWVREYARRRYGREHAQAETAWRMLLETVYSAGGPPAPALEQRPSLKVSGGGPGYDPRRLVEAWETLQGCAGALGNLETYRYDLVNVARQVLANLSTPYAVDMIDAYRAMDRKGFKAAAERFLDLIHDVDTVTATRSEFLLGRWITDAKRWATNDTEARLYEWNARNQVTLWGPRDSVLHEYARKQWSGLIQGFYLSRWESFVLQLSTAIETGTAVDTGAFEADITAWEESWTHRTDVYPDRPRGNGVANAEALLDKYRPRFAEIWVPETRTVSLTTGKPASCSSALAPYPAQSANDGLFKDTDRYWATDVSQDPEPWWQVDLGEGAIVGRVLVVAYYGDDRCYGFTVETSLDGEQWDIATDRRDNREPSTKAGYVCRFTPRPTRYLRVKQTSNSANTGRHLVEVMAFAE